MNLLVMGLIVLSFPCQISCLVMLSSGQKLNNENYGKTVLNEEIPVHK